MSFPSAFWEGGCCGHIAHLTVKAGSRMASTSSSEQKCGPDGGKARKRGTGKGIPADLCGVIASVVHLVMNWLRVNQPHCSVTP